MTSYTLALHAGDAIGPPVITVVDGPLVPNAGELIDIHTFTDDAELQRLTDILAIDLPRHWRVEHVTHALQLGDRPAASSPLVTAVPAGCTCPPLTTRHFTVCPARPEPR